MAPWKLVPKILTVPPPLVEPVLGDTVLIVRAVEAEMLMESPADAVAALESFTWALKEKEPAVMGFPVIIPVEELSERPLGSWPPIVLHVYGDIPPVACSVAE